MVRIVRWLPTAPNPRYVSARRTEFSDDGRSQPMFIIAVAIFFHAREDLIKIRFQIARHPDARGIKIHVILFFRAATAR